MKNFEQLRYLQLVMVRMVIHNYVKMSADTLARTCEAVEREECDGDEALCVQNLISTAGYVHTALVSVGGACCEYGWCLL